MSSALRSLVLVALPLGLTACQTYEASYVETPSVRRTVVVERSYDPFDEPRTIYTQRRVYREPVYDPFYEPRPRYYGPRPRYDDYEYRRERRFERDYDAPVRRPVPPGVVTGPVYRGQGPIVSGPAYRGGSPDPVYQGPTTRVVPQLGRRDGGFNTDPPVQNNLGSQQ